MSAPDFIGIGSSRCGTTSLYHVLRAHPNIWLTPIKEIHFWDTLDQKVSKNKIHRIRVLSRIKKQIVALFLFNRDELQYLVWDFHFARRKNKHEWYQALFQPEAGQLGGEITPAYSTLSLKMVRQIADLYPSLKIIFMLRDPIERGWSSAVKSLTRIKKIPPAEIPLGDYYTFFNGEGYKLRANYLRTLNNWQEVFPADQIFVGFLEDMKNNPDAFFQDLCDFLNIPFYPEIKISKMNSIASFKTEIPKELAYFLAHKNLEQLKELSLRLETHVMDWLVRAEDLISSNQRIDDGG